MTLSNGVALSIRPFKAAAPDKALADLKQLLRIARIGPETLENTTHADVSYGLSRAWVQDAREYWLSAYDWRRTEERINSFGNFKATLVDEHGAASEMHFITLRSQKPNAIPVVLLHGWPGSPLEFLDMLDLLRDRYTSEELPYTIIVPSLPGYGFSSGPSLQTPSSSDTIAYAVNQLMVGLGHGEGYIAHGGDIGSLVARVLAAKYPACKAAHVNFFLTAAPASVPPDAIDDSEMQGLARAQSFNTQGDAYAKEHGKRPATIGLLLSTSPLALLIWVGEKFLEWADKPLSMDQILDNVTLYWLTETFPRSIYPYRQFLTAPTEPNVLTYHISKPLGYSWFPREVVPIPKAWVSSVANLVWHRQHTEGGHFAAMEYPQVLLTDLEDFVAQVWKQSR